MTALVAKYVDLALILLFTGMGYYMYLKKPSSLVCKELFAYQTAIIILFNILSFVLIILREVHTAKTVEDAIESGILSEGTHFQTIRGIMLKMQQITEHFLPSWLRFSVVFTLLIYMVLLLGMYLLIHRLHRHTNRLLWNCVFMLVSIGFVMIWGIDLLARILLPESYHPVPVDLLRGGADRVRPAADKLRKRLGIPLPRANANGKNILPLLLFLAGAALLINGGGFIAKHFGCDYSYGGIGTIALLYIFYKVRPLSLLIAWIWLTSYNNNELLAITGFWLIWCYNGRRGRQNKYFFYVFYPAHLMLLYLIRRQIFGV